MAAVIGAALATLAGTSPLAVMRDHFTWATVGIITVGILLLGGTLFLVLQVMRPQSVSYADVQASKRRPLRKWKETVEEQEDLYLPSGVKCLTSLRQSMIVEEVTLIALAHESARVGEGAEATRIQQAREVRTARLKELRGAAARVATIGEFYRVRSRSTWATYLGLPLGLLGTVAVVLAFAWPQL